MKTWIVSSLDEETIQGEETIWGNTVPTFGKSLYTFWASQKKKSNKETLYKFNIRILTPEGDV